MADEDRAVIYDREWKTVGEFTVAMDGDGQALVRSGPADALKPGELYYASIYGRYYATKPEPSGGSVALRLNAWGKGTPAGAALPG
ncbi:MAG: hypothetical protein O3B31_08035 [Chloroflexi bacterium]|nr:hypothetical protein [Chloroflexota bacterium]